LASSLVNFWAHYKIVRLTDGMSKVTVILQFFLHQMLTVSTFLLKDALLKRVVTKVLFSVACCGKRAKIVGYLKNSRENSDSNVTVDIT